MANFEIGTTIYVRRNVIARVLDILFQKGLLAGAANRMQYYYHYGVYIGDDKVIHFSGESYSTAKISLIDFHDFEHGNQFDFLVTGYVSAEECVMVNYAYERSEVCNRARSKLYGSFDGYDLLKNNCEHFANWCACGKKISRQSFVSDDAGCGEKAIDRVFEPVQKAAKVIDNFFGWGKKK